MSSPRANDSARWSGRRLLAAGTVGVGLLAAGAALATRPVTPACSTVPDELVGQEVALPRLAQRLNSRGQVNVVLLGSGSLAGGGIVGPAHSYPAQLRERLRERFPDTPIAVEAIARKGATAAELAATVRSDVLALKPTLVIWHTGAVDAMRGIPLAEFNAALDNGVSTLHKNNVDVMLVEPQYNPYSQAFADSDTYRGYMRWAARRHGIPLFRRYAIMEHWSDEGAFDLTTRDRSVQAQNAVRIFGCFGALLADAIEAGIRNAPPSQPPDRPALR